jgi:hypothetical protein
MCEMRKSNIDRLGIPRLLSVLSLELPIFFQLFLGYISTKLVALIALLIDSRTFDFVRTFLEFSILKHLECHCKEQGRVPAADCMGPPRALVSYICRRWNGRR